MIPLRDSFSIPSFERPFFISLTLRQNWSRRLCPSSLITKSTAAAAAAQIAGGRAVE